jgi:hypothetical protein
MGARNDDASTLAMVYSGAMLGSKVPRIDDADAVVLEGVSSFDGVLDGVLDGVPDDVGTVVIPSVLYDVT